MASGKVQIELIVDDKGSVRILEAKRHIDDLGRAAQASSSSMESLGYGLSAVAAKLLAVIGSVYTLQRALSFAVTQTDQYRVGLIAVASTLSDIASDKNNPALNYARNLEYAKEMYAELERVAARHFASGRELQEAMNIALQKGVLTRKQDLEYLATVVDKILLMTQGQNRQIQLAQELRALFEGQARAGSVLANLMESRIGPGWEEVLKQQRESGRLWEYLANLFPGLQYAVKDIENNFSSQKETLLTNLSIIMRQTDIYQDVVDLLKWLNSNLEQNKSIIDAINSAWRVMAELVQAVVILIQGMADLLSKLRVPDLVGEWKRQMSELARGRADLGAGLGLDVMPGLESVTQEADVRNKLKANQMLAEQAAKYKAETYQMYLRQLGPTPIERAPAAPAGGGGGGGGRDTARQMERLIDTLEKELARLTGGNLAVILEWYDEIIKKIEEYAASAVEAEQAIELARRVGLAKYEREVEQFERWYISQLGDRYRQIDWEERDNLRKYSLTREQMVQLAEITGRALVELERENQERIDRIREVAAIKRYDETIKREKELVSAQQQVMEAWASASPLLREQLAYRETALQLEQQLYWLELERRVNLGEITKEMATQLWELHNMAIRAKQFQMEMQKWELQGVYGGLKMYQMDLAKRSEIYLAKGTYDMLKSMESDIAKAISSGIINALRGGKADFEEMGWTIAEAFIRKLTEMWVSQILNLITKTFEGILGSIFGVGIAHGGVFIGGELQPYARGGVVSRPTIFPMATGWGLMGEEGPEAVLPLTRINGDLGVKAQVAPAAISITVVNNTGVPVEANARQTGDEIEVVLDRMVARTLRRGGETTRALMDFGIRPVPIGR